ncbi:MAG: hypothetical protein GY772_18160 [bacterium]|nr:hypothetical protein [bacterium]
MAARTARGCTADGLGQGRKEADWRRRRQRRPDAEEGRLAAAARGSHPRNMMRNLLGELRGGGSLGPAAGACGARCVAAAPRGRRGRSRERGRAEPGAGPWGLRERTAPPRSAGAAAARARGRTRAARPRSGEPRPRGAPQRHQRRRQDAPPAERQPRA